MHGTLSPAVQAPERACDLASLIGPGDGSSWLVDGPEAGRRCRHRRQISVLRLAGAASSRQSPRCQVARFAAARPPSRRADTADRESATARAAALSPRLLSAISHRYGANVGSCGVRIARPSWCRRAPVKFANNLAWLSPRASRSYHLATEVTNAPIAGVVRRKSKSDIQASNGLGGRLLSRVLQKSRHRCYQHFGSRRLRHLRFAFGNKLTQLVEARVDDEGHAALFQTNAKGGAVIPPQTVVDNHGRQAVSFHRLRSVAQRAAVVTLAPARSKASAMSSAIRPSSSTTRIERPAKLVLSMIFTPSSAEGNISRSDGLDARLAEIFSGTAGSMETTPNRSSMARLPVSTACGEWRGGYSLGVGERLPFRRLP